MPRFRGQLTPVETAYAKVMGAGDRWVNATLTAQMKAMSDYAAERAASAATGD